MSAVEREPGVDLDALNAELRALGGAVQGKAEALGVAVAPSTKPRNLHPNGAPPPTGVGTKDLSLSDAKREQQKGEVIRYLAANYSVREAAKALNLTPNTIYRWFQQDQTMMSRLKALNEHLAEELNGQVFQAQLNFKQRLTQAADDALNEMESLMWTSSSEGIRLKAAQDLLDRDGRAPRTAKTEGRQINVNIDADMVKLAMQAAAEDSARGR